MTWWERLRLRALPNALAARIVFDLVDRLSPQFIQLSIGLRRHDAGRIDPPFCRRPLTLGCRAEGKVFGDLRKFFTKLLNHFIEANVPPLLPGLPNLRLFPVEENRIRQGMDLLRDEYRHLRKKKTAVTQMTNKYPKAVAGRG